MKAVDDVLRTCEQTADSVIGLQVPVPEKIEKLKVGPAFGLQRSIIMHRVSVFSNVSYVSNREW